LPPAEGVQPSIALGRRLRWSAYSRCQVPGCSHRRHGVVRGRAAFQGLTEDHANGYRLDGVEVVHERRAVFEQLHVPGPLRRRQRAPARMLPDRLQAPVRLAGSPHASAAEKASYTGSQRSAMAGARFRTG
jgi:hypothetical protein